GLARRSCYHRVGYRNRAGRILCRTSEVGSAARPEHPGGRSKTGLVPSLVLRAPLADPGKNLRLCPDRLPRPEWTLSALCSDLESQGGARGIATPVGDCLRLSRRDHDWRALVGR